VRWKALSELAAHEMADPSPLNTRAASMENVAQKAEFAYRESLKLAISAEAESAIVSWKMDRFDSIY
jgi:hypothetical protein